jgi:hypothetical protein
MKKLVLAIILLCSTFAIAGESVYETMKREMMEGDGKLYQPVYPGGPRRLEMPDGRRYNVMPGAYPGDTMRVKPY